MKGFLVVVLVLAGLFAGGCSLWGIFMLLFMISEFGGASGEDLVLFLLPLSGILLAFFLFRGAGNVSRIDEGTADNGPANAPNVQGKLEFEYRGMKVEVVNDFYTIDGKFFESVTAAEDYIDSILEDPTHK